MLKLLFITSILLLLVIYLGYVPRFWKSPLAIGVIIYSVALFIFHEKFLHMSVGVVILLNLFLVISVIVVQERAYNARKKSRHSLSRNSTDFNRTSGL